MGAMSAGFSADRTIGSTAAGLAYAYYQTASASSMSLFNGRTGHSAALHARAHNMKPCWAVLHSTVQ